MSLCENDWIDPSKEINISLLRKRCLQEGYFSHPHHLSELK